MHIRKNISKYLINENENIREALIKINKNEDGQVICLDDTGVFLGILTDGDFRKWILSTNKISIDQPISRIINRDVITASLGDSNEKIQLLMNKKKGLKLIPVLDKNKRCIYIATRKKPYIDIGKHRIGKGYPCFNIAEIGNNHQGDINLAFKLIDKAKESGADCAKFQIRDLDSLYQFDKGKGELAEDLGSQYTLDLLKKYQLSIEELYTAFDYCHKIGIEPLCTAWDFKSLERLEKYGLNGYKVASADLVNHDLLQKIASTGKPMICSTGMSNDSEIKESIKLLNKIGAQFALLHCNSTYPAPFSDINLKFMETLSESGECPVGYSSHDRGINIVISAVSLGANIIEKHFTLDRSLEGNDHRVSLLPDEMKNMVSSIKEVEEALGQKDKRIISQGEMMNRETLGKSLFVNKTIKKGEIFDDSFIFVSSPGRGLQPNKKSELLGIPANRDIEKGSMLFSTDLGISQAKPRIYNFKTKFGIPVRYHDLNSLSKASNFDLLEFHLSYRDIEIDINPFFEKNYDMDLVVHAPELFKSEHILDLCSLDFEYRKKSIRNLKRVVDLTHELNQYFRKSQNPRIIINAGGFTQDRPLPKNKRKELYVLIIDSLKRIDTSGVEIIPQTMPPFPWHFGGQRFHNLFVDPDEIKEFCEEFSYKICFDVSHSKLACNHYNWSFSDFIKKVIPFTSHMHIADAAGKDGEGLGVGEGEIDFSIFKNITENKNYDLSFIPEIWQGHKNNGQGFWESLEKLESFF